jgi:hypothetical protein
MSSNLGHKKLPPIPADGTAQVLTAIREDEPF